MKKIFLIIVLAVLGISARAQAVSDMAVIPIGVTLNSIARITVTSGGNIEFVVNTMEQYRYGVPATTATTTTFSVACSSKFGVTLQADNEFMYGTVNSAHKMSTKFIGYALSSSSIGTANLGAEGVLTNTAVYIIKGTDGDTKCPAGQYTGNTIAWSLKETDGNQKLTDLSSDRYVVNAFLQLKQDN